MRRTIGAMMLAIGVAVNPQAGWAQPEYNRDIRPILAENCFACHGPDSASRKAHLRLDQRDAAIKAEAIVPGSPDRSALVQRICADDPKEIMPPAKTLKKLTAGQKELLKRWIASGAEYQPHWSFIPPKRPPVPAVKNTSWVRNPIDAFILARLEAIGLAPAPEADRRTLARRASLDLIGLPPAPEEVEAFVRDTAPDAYERYVDKLLESPRWGEHRGRYWLDLARYADTHGIHFDNFREIHAYRDWVIGAFNRNLPFDRFTIEQLAGDLLPNPTLDQRVATGFNRCNITTNEGGTIPEEYLVLYTRDRTETVAQVWLGLTAGCCVCHDHKFDPLTMRDFYSMSAFFNNTTQNAMDGNIANTPPIIAVPRLEDRPRWEAIEKDLAKVRADIAARKNAVQKDFDAWLAKTRGDDLAKLLPIDGLRLEARLDEGKGEEFTVLVDGKPRTLTAKDGYTWVAGKLAAKAAAVKPGPALEFADAGDFEKNQPFTASAWVNVPRRGNVGAIAARMENAPIHRGWDLWMEQDRIGMHIINTWPNDALKVTSKQPLQPNQWYHVLVSYDGSGKAAGVRVYLNGTPQAVDVFTDKLQSTIRTKVPLKIGQRHGSERLKDVAIQDVRLYGRSLTPAEVVQLARTPRAQELLALPAAKRGEKERGELLDWYLSAMDDATRTLSGKQGELMQEETALRSRGTVAHVMQERSEEPIAYMLFRGDYDKRRDKVKAMTPTSLPPMASDLPHNRLGFAKWLLSPDHPLTTRVTVNRYWQEVFGTGIVRTSGDFGVTGDVPSHPELLDWLAIEFSSPSPRSSPARGEGGMGWDNKEFFKMLVTSATYRQSALISKAALEKDPQNRLLSRAPRYRMDAEMIRDYALAASGLLSGKIGGPSVKPYQPEGVWEAVGMIGSNTRDYKRDSGEALYRRGLYTFWKRAAPPASLDILNAPNREFCTVRRERTNTPLQALVTLNDPQFVEAARALAQLTLKQSGATEARLDFMAKRLLCRPLRAEELPVVQRSLSELLAYYQGHADDAAKLINVGESRPEPTMDAPALAAWTMLANELFNLDEVLNK
jgi:Protein of unknown function (DUF1553)/Protein of unknown function (DUF1549)/Concanavalin A-like lectin/glucanases superfamily/Planctomycete cytochrome C